MRNRYTEITTRHGEHTECKKVGAARLLLLKIGAPAKGVAHKHQAASRSNSSTLICVPQDSQKQVWRFAQSCNWRSPGLRSCADLMWHGSDPFCLDFLFILCRSHEDSACRKNTEVDAPEQADRRPYQDSSVHWHDCEVEYRDKRPQLPAVDHEWERLSSDLPLYGWTIPTPFEGSERCNK